MGVLDADSGALEELAVSHHPARTMRLTSDGRRVAYVGASPVRAPAIVVVDTTSHELEVVAESSTDVPDAGYLSEPEPVEFESRGGRTAHALYYPPRNREFEAPEFKVDSKDEIGTLSESFGRMRTSLTHAMKMLDA